MTEVCVWDEIVPMIRPTCRHEVRTPYHTTGNSTNFVPWLSKPEWCDTFQRLAHAFHHNGHLESDFHRVARSINDYSKTSVRFGDTQVNRGCRR